MKQTFLICATVVALLGGMTSCKKESPASAAADANALKCGRYTPPPPCNPTPPPTSDCGAPTTVALKINNRTTVGTVTVSNDATSLKVKYTTTSSYKLDDLHLYVGATGSVPTRYGSVNTNSFPHSKDINNNNTTTYTITVPLSSLPSCFSVFANADVRGSGYGCNNNSQDAWGDGTRYTGQGCGNNSSAYYFTYCKATCSSDTCLVPQGVLFNPEGSWPNGDANVTVGGFVYTKSDVVSQYYVGDNDAKTALLLIATLKVYGNKITIPAVNQAQATTVENWLATLGRLGSSSQFTAPANVATALAALQAWEIGKTCQ